MRCKDFLALYSDFRDDGIVDPTMNRRMRQHLAHCRSCARYHHALEFGTSLLRELDPVEPSDRFLVRLRCALALSRRRTNSGLPVFGWPASLAATMLVAVVIVKGVAREPQEDINQAEVSGATPARVEVSRPAAAVRARFESLTPPSFRPHPLRFAPASLDLDSGLQTWPRTDPGSNYLTVHATLSR
jgi:hypothetical protein